MTTAQVTVNGRQVSLEAPAGRTLLTTLRDDLGLTGTKYSCLEGVCGACTVLVDDDPVRSCTTTVAEVDGRAVTTVEGLAADGNLHPVQQAFLDELGFQCGFCTPGQLMTAAGLLAGNPTPSDDEIVEAMNDNVCRCCTYPRIRRAVRRAAELARGERVTPMASDGSGADLDPTAAFPRPGRPWDRQDIPERDWFGVLGDGLVVVLPPDAVQRPTAAGEYLWSSPGGAWIHLGSDETVTAFTGKVDVGQDNRTALTMLLADELRMPLDRVRLVMGDSDVCPFDLGTFGSRSMADAGACLRAVGAATRRVLASVAAERWGVAAESVTVGDCRIERGDGAWIGYGELVRGERRIERAALDESTTGGVERRTVGGPVHRIHALDVVLGRRPYGIDIARPGMLIGQVVRPPALHAELQSVDLEPAERIPGLVAVVEGDFIGVAAPDLETARAAAASIRADWTIESGPTEDEIVDYLRSHPTEADGWESEDLGEEGRSGDVDRALASASVTIEQTYTAAYLAHVPLETRDAVAEWEDGRLTVWTGTQRPFGVRADVAGALGLAEDDVRVIVPYTGGGFGGKHSGEAAIEAARLARAAGRPVQVRWTREEEMTWAYFRPYAVIDVRAGIDAGGMLQAWEFTNTNSGPMAILTPYSVPNRRIRYEPAASPLRTGSYRALAATANTFAREVAMDELATGLGIDPVEFRLRHIADDRLAAVIRAVADQAGWGNPAAGDHIGMGIAAGVEKDAYVATVAVVRVRPEGPFELLRVVVAFDCGEIVNADGLRNQVEGATVMGLGGALFEAVHFRNGRILTPTIKEYRVPRMSDVPPIDVILIDRPDLPPAGAGETPIIGVAPAISNAIFAACGVRLRALPLVPHGTV